LKKLPRTNTLICENYREGEGGRGAAFKGQLRPKPYQIETTGTTTIQISEKYRNQ